MELFGLSYLGGKLLDKLVDKPSDALLDNVIKTKQESLRIKEIHAQINQFNLSFEGTELDDVSLNNGHSKLGVYQV